MSHRIGESLQNSCNGFLKELNPLKSDKAKIGIMLSYTGKEAREIYKTLLWTADRDANKFNKVCKAFQNHCLPCKNIIYKRYSYWSLQQDEGEPVNAYLTRLKVKIDT